MIAVLGDMFGDADREQLRQEFHRLRDQVQADHIVFLGLKLGEAGGAQEVMSVALPGSSSVPDPPQGSAAEDVQVADARAELVSIPGGEAIVHSSSAPAFRSTDLGASWAQVVTRLPGAVRGAIVTLLSSKAGQEKRLGEEGLSVAESLALSPSATAGS